MLQPADLRCQTRDGLRTTLEGDQMGVGTKPVRRLPWIRALVALSLAAAPVVLSAGPAHAQPAVLGLRKAVSLPAPNEVAPATPFTYFLSYSCSSLSQDCVGATITDVIPPQLSRQVQDVKLSGNFRVRDLRRGDRHRDLRAANPVPAGTPRRSPSRPSSRRDGRRHPGRQPGHHHRIERVAGDVQPGHRHRQGGVEVDGHQERRAGAAPQVDTPYTYRVGITLAAGGTQNLNGVVFTDTLPAGAQFVSATGGGTFANGVVTWPPATWSQPERRRDLIEEVTVIFPAASFPVGTKILNLVVANGTPAGEPTQELGRAQRPGTIGGAGTVTAGSKKDTKPELGPGQSDAYTLTAENPNATAIAGFHVLETLPPPAGDGAGRPAQPDRYRTGTGLHHRGPGRQRARDGAGPWSATAPASNGTLLFDYGNAPPASSPRRAGRHPGQRDRPERSAHRRRLDHLQLHRHHRRRARPSTGTSARPRRSSR